MIAYRLCLKQFAGSAFTGEGARRSGGRWNPIGVAMVYASESLALAVLENLVHLGREDLLPSFVFFEIEIVGSLIDEALVSLDKMSMPEHESQFYGQQWVMRNEFPALLVPSAIVPTERNLLLNPANPDFNKIQIAGPYDFSMDARLSR